MSSSTPVIRQIAWIALIPQFAFIGLLMFLYSLVHMPEPEFTGALTYLVLSILLKKFVPKDQRQGMKLLRKEKFKEAIGAFQKSYDFFSRHSWLDKYRYITLLNSSRISYREMALNNIAFCYGQDGDIPKAKEYYERILQEFPDSGLARVGLRFINSIADGSATVE